MRKHVKPADLNASIPDPARGRDLPPEGLPCEWSVHWARMQARGDVIVTDIPEAAAEQAPSAPVVAADAASPDASSSKPAADTKADPPPTRSSKS